MKVSTLFQKMRTARSRHNADPAPVQRFAFLKFALVLVLSFCLKIQAAASQQGISLSEKNAPLEKVLTKIRKQSHYLILYNNELLKKAKPVTIEANNLSVEEVLRLCFMGQPFMYELVDQTILIKPLPASRENKVQPPA